MGPQSLDVLGRALGALVSGQTLVVDDIDTVLDSRASGRDTFLQLIGVSRQRGTSVVLVGKSPASIPAWIRCSADVIVYRPAPDARSRQWWAAAGLDDTTPDDDHTFHVVVEDRPTGAHQSHEVGRAVAENFS